MGDRIHAALMLAIGVFGFAGWTLYWTTDLFVKPHDPLWNRYEDTFVLADLVMCSAYLAAAWLLLRRRVLAVPLGIAAAGGTVFLLCMDLLFNLQNGYYRDATPVTVLEVGINLLCLAFGPFTIVRLWRRRLALEPRAAGGPTLSSSSPQPPSELQECRS